MIQYKTPIAQLIEIEAADSTTVIPVSTGTPLATKKIRVENLIKDSAVLAGKANLVGGNSFTGVQNIDGSVVIAANKSISSPRVDTSILNIEPTGDGIWSDDVHVMTRAELLYLTGLTSNVQSQINSKATLSSSNSFSGPTNAFTNYITIMSGGITIGGGIDGKYIETREDNLLVKADQGELTLSGDAGVLLADDAYFYKNISLVGPTSSIMFPGGDLTIAELVALSGVTSSVQTQLNGKAGLTSNNLFTNTNTFSGAVVANGGMSIMSLSNLSADLITDGSYELRIDVDGIRTVMHWADVVSLYGVTSNVQTQLNLKANLGSPNTFSGIQTFSDNAVFGFGASISAGLQLGGPLNTYWSDYINIDTEEGPETLSWNDILALKNITSNIQEQLNEKADLSGINAFTGTYNAFSNEVTVSDGGIILNGGVGDKHISSREANLTINADLGELHLSGDDGVHIDSGAIFSGALEIAGSTGIDTGSGVISPTELSYLSGISSSVQTQLNGKGGLTANNTFSGSNIFSGGVTISNLSSITSDIIVTNTNDIRIFNGVSNELVGWSEVQTLQGISSNIQDQIDSKVSNTYKRYSCILTQTGTGAPQPLAGTITNEFSNNFVWSYSSDGAYIITALSGTPFTVGKSVLIQNGSMYYNDLLGASVTYTGSRGSDTQFWLHSTNIASGTPVDDAIDSIYIEIRVYN